MNSHTHPLVFVAGGYPTVQQFMPSHSGQADYMSYCLDSLQGVIQGLYKGMLQGLLGGILGA